MIINVTNLLEKNEIDPFGLLKLSNKPFFKKLSQLQKCELINDMRFPLGVVMSTPKEVLKRIGFRPKSVSEVINQILNLDKVENEIIIVPKGVEHKPIAEEEVSIMLFEPATTINTGALENKFTRKKLESI